MLHKIVMLAALLPGSAIAENWVYEFEFGYKVTASRLMLPQCEKVVPLHFAYLYAQEPRNGWTVNCGGNNPVYNHFLGRKIGQPLPKLRLELGWRHMSHAFDSSEMTYDALSVRGRFTW